MSTLPSERLLASYWIPYVGIGQDPMEKVYVPLLDILNYSLPNGNPQTNVVFLFSADFTGTPQNFNAPYISIPDDILNQLVPQPGQSKSNVQQLQERGIKVLLSIKGYSPGPRQSGMGWDGVPANKNQAFASWLQMTVIDEYGLDGIDIDNEFSNLPKNTQAFIDTVATLREYLYQRGALLSKALWEDTDYFKVPASSNAPFRGKYLRDMLDFGSTMAYGYGAADQKDFVQSYTSITTPSGQNVGMPLNKLCLGVQAGPPELDWMTALSEVQELAPWVVENQLLGMMLFTFTQDIQQWDQWPQNSPQYMWRNPGDHLWQKTIIDGMWGITS